MSASTPTSGQTWPPYARSVIGFRVVSVLGLYLLLRMQGALPLNPTGVDGFEPALAFNTAVSFVTGTNWQAYAGENTASHGAQMFGLVVGQFTAAAVGMSVALAMVRGLRYRRAAGDSHVPLLGNFWVDLTRNTVRVLLPLAIVGAVLLASQGAVQNLDGNLEVTTVEGAAQVIPGGPSASQEVIKTLGTNGGGFYNTNSAHPFENPNGLSNVISLLLVVAIPFAFALMYGRMVADRRQGRMLLAIMAVLWLAPIIVGAAAEADGNDRLAAVGVEQAADAPEGGNMEGKEVRLGTAASTTLAIGTMGTSAGVASSALDSYTPIGGLSALAPILLGEISPGGVGSGLYAMLIYVLLAVFIGGLMVGRTPELLGKKVGGAQIRLVVLYVLTLPVVILAGAAAAVVLPTALESRLNDGPHGFTEIFYAYASAANGNGSAFAGLNANTDWYNTTLGIAMLAGRFLLIVPVLALAGSFARAASTRRRSAPCRRAARRSAGCSSAVTLIVGGLTYLPALILGPIVEQLS